MQKQKRIWKRMAALVLAVTLALPCLPERVEAKAKETVIDWDYPSGASFTENSLDLTGDGKADQIKVKASASDYSGEYYGGDGKWHKEYHYVSFEIYVNGKRLKKVKLKNSAYGWAAKAFQSGDGESFLALMGTEEDDCLSLFKIYRYQGGKLKCISGSVNKWISHEVYGFTLSGNQWTFSTYSNGCSGMGGVWYTFKAIDQDGSLKPQKTAKLAAYDGSPAYRTAAKNITAYTSTDSKTKAFTVPEGAKVLL